MKNYFKNNFNHQNWDLIPVWISLGLMTIAPFLSIFRVGPQSGFFLESASVLFALIFVLMTSLSLIFYPIFNQTNQNNQLNQNINLNNLMSFYWIILAIFWAIQARVLNVVYVGLSDLTAWVFVIFALLAWACRQWIAQFGQDRIVKILAWCIVIGASLQSIVAWLQYTDLAGNFSGFLMYRKGIVEGQLGQRNHFGHYMMWGILSVAFLWGKKSLKYYIALFLLINFSAVMGLTGSRTIFAYLLGLIILLPIWKLINYKNNQDNQEFNRYLWIFVVAIGLVFAGQFLIEQIIQLIIQNNGSVVDSAAERLNNSSFSHSGRNYEWKKAWLIFQSAPFFGYGWGSYSYQGFLETRAYDFGFRNYEGNVLFTHSHNSFLNMLAEMGLIGTLLILSGLIWCIKTAIQNKYRSSFYLLAMMSVSLIHSFLEYPLWYIYFLTVFALFMSLFESKSSQQPQQSPKNIQYHHYLNYLNYLILLINMILIFGVMRLSLVYQDLRTAASQANVASTERINKIMILLNISKTEPMLKYYADLSLIDHIDPKKSPQPTWAYQVAKQSSLFRPYANAHKWGFVAYQAGEHDTAREWLKNMYHYYPTKLAIYGDIIMNTPYYEGLKSDYTKYCQEYYQTIQKKPNCAESLPSLDKLENILKNQASNLNNLNNLNNLSKPAIQRNKTQEIKIK